MIVSTSDKTASGHRDIEVKKYDGKLKGVCTRAMKCMPSKISEEKEAEVLGSPQRGKFSLGAFKGKEWWWKGGGGRN